ncbi:NAD(P)/FAD-dependent oxidoreductase [Halomonas cupida]|uniref:NAD(P)/FAD-dependent oxidoreductase n=1 Tax=Halomonas cupida TaxID=44933 RepID=UPI003A8CD021
MSVPPQGSSTRQNSRSSVVLVGAGHSHLHLIKHLDTRKYAATLIDPGAFWYSGSASAMLAGDLKARDARIDPARTCRQRGILLIRRKVIRVDTRHRRLMLDDATEVSYDVLSLTPGSRIPPPRHDLADVESWAVKPISRLLALRARLRRQLREQRHIRILVVGAGASGIEIACALRQLGMRHGAGPERLDIVLLHNGAGPLPGAPPGCRRWIGKSLQRRDIQLVANPRPDDTADDIPSSLLATADHVILATGLRPATDALGLAAAGSCGLPVDRQLRVLGLSDVLAAGDGIDFDGRKLARIGVHGVRQGPVLLHNLQATLEGQPLRDYQPPKRALSIINLSADEGVALYGRYWWGGKAALVWKRWLDRRFIELHRD